MLKSMLGGAGREPDVGGGAEADVVLILGTVGVVLLTLALILVLTLWLAPQRDGSGDQQR